MGNEIEDRKRDHIMMVAAGRSSQDNVATGFDAIRFEHRALPEIDMDQIDMSQPFCGRMLKLPVLVSAMTGDPAEANTINAHLAEACQQMGMALAVGSQRIAIEKGVSGGLDGSLRRLAPDIPILANFGAVQLNYGFGPDQARRAIDMIEADALILHLNPLQEAVQSGGDRNFAGLLGKIDALARVLTVPLGVKEVGAGLSGQDASRLRDAGVQIFDVAGVGGTSWARIEAERSGSERMMAVAAPFFDWGIPTALALQQVTRAVAPAPVIASGGVRHGLDIARAIRLGATLGAQAGSFLGAAQTSTQAVMDHAEILASGLRIAMFCTGSANLADLSRAALLYDAEA